MNDYNSQFPAPSIQEAKHQLKKYFIACSTQIIKINNKTYNIDYRNLLHENDDKSLENNFENLIVNNIFKYEKITKSKISLGSEVLWSLKISGEIKEMININIVKYYLDKNDKNELQNITMNELKKNQITPTSSPNNSPNFGVFSPRTFKKFVIDNSEIINSIIDYIFINIKT
tara:strand:+ start:993 stop:1511 length:519 start_codon:yes stop_codon:yes gene_type:complete